MGNFEENFQKNATKKFFFFEKKKPHVYCPDSNRIQLIESRANIYISLQLNANEQYLHNETKNQFRISFWKQLKIFVQVKAKLSVFSLLFLKKIVSTKSWIVNEWTFTRMSSPKECTSFHPTAPNSNGWCVDCNPSVERQSQSIGLDTQSCAPDPPNRLLSVKPSPIS